MLVEGPIDYINYSAGTSEKKLRTNLSKAKKTKQKQTKKIGWACITMVLIVICL